MSQDHWTDPVRHSGLGPKKALLLAAPGLAAVAAVVSLYAAVGCDLNDPDRDVKRLFLESTSYKTLYVSISRKGGDDLLRRIEARLGDKYTGLYETADVPYTMYEIYKGADLVGYNHGVNQKGTYGGIQVFLALDTAGFIRGFYFQKLTSREAKAFRALAFGEQFLGLSLEDFHLHDSRVPESERADDERGPPEGHDPRRRGIGRPDPRGPAVPRPSFPGNAAAQPQEHRPGGIRRRPDGDDLQVVIENPRTRSAPRFRRGADRSHLHHVELDSKGNRLKFTR